MTTAIVTTSWDDGDPLDLRIAEMLRSRNIKATFYVPIIGYLGRPTLTAQHLRNMVQENFEIGAHSYSHRSLRRLQPQELQSEVVRSRELLENRAGHGVSMFCYPNGLYDELTLSTVRDAGYRGARTTRMLYFGAGRDAFEIPTTLQAYPHSAAAYVRNTLKDGNVKGVLRAWPTVFSADWITLGKSLFDHVLAHGGVWHLYGHSWEVEQHSLWSGLGELLDYVAERQEVRYLTNGELCSVAFPEREPALSLAS